MFRHEFYSKSIHIGSKGESRKGGFVKGNNCGFGRCTKKHADGLMDYGLVVDLEHIVFDDFTLSLATFTLVGISIFFTQVRRPTFLTWNALKNGRASFVTCTVLEYSSTPVLRTK